MRKIIGIAVVAFLLGTLAPYFILIKSGRSLEIWNTCDTDRGQKWTGAYMEWASNGPPGHYGFSSDSCDKEP